MGIPIRRLQDEISSDDFALYQAYNRIDPFGDERFDLIGGIICNTIARVHGNKRTKPGDFMVEWEKPERKKKSPAEFYAMFKQLTIATGGKVIE